MGKLRVLAKRLLARHMLMIEFCRDCGRTDEAWTIEDWFWILVVGQKDGTTLCLSCFDKRAARKGLHPIYRITVENVDRPATPEGRP